MTIVSLGLIIVAAAGYIYRHEIGERIGAVRLAVIESFSPCSTPITYRIGSIDQRFGISKKEILNTFARAEAFWETPLHRELFAVADPDSRADITVNFIYDYRQETTNTLAKLDTSIDNNTARYDQLKTTVDTLEQEYNIKRAALETEVAQYKKAEAAYNSSVESWNARGGAPHEEYEKLEQKRAALEEQIRRISIDENELNVLGAKLRSNIDALNHLATELNSTGRTYNSIGRSTGREFNEGEYTSNASGQSITIYQFSDREKLLKVLAHELGHALGLDHVDDTSAIMYYLNNDSPAQLSPSDLNVLIAHCEHK